MPLNINISTTSKLVILAFNSIAATSFITQQGQHQSRILWNLAPHSRKEVGALSIFESLFKEDPPTISPPDRGEEGVVVQQEAAPAEEETTQTSYSSAAYYSYKKNGRGQEKEQQFVPTTTPDVPKQNNFFGNKIDGFIEDTFDKADTNGNGRISASETYDLVLQIYLKINRQAPINPPSREKVALIFDNADKDQNGDIDRAEFKRLMVILLSRASTRLVAHKFLTLVGAPFLAWELTGFLSDKVGLLHWVATKLIAEQQYLETVTNEGFWQTVFTVLFVTTLGDTILTKTSSIYDKLLIKEKE